ncbi:MAG: pantoate--beta-alanine ligase [Terriglobus sp.]
MRVIHSVAEMRSVWKQWQREGAEVGLVPTMGALHEGHLSLVRASKLSCARTVVSIFVNPLQFGPQEDFAQYPRTLEEDCRLLETVGADVVFAPNTNEMYPSTPQTIVDVPKIGGRLDGAFRQGHFRGVATVVSKLFNIVRPNRAFFGQKDAAQVAVLKAMVRDLNYDVEMVICPIVRESGGLAMSSRNRYLTEKERCEAACLSRALERVQQAVADGVTSIPALGAVLRDELSAEPALQVEYAEIVDPDSLIAVYELLPQTLVAVAARVGSTRLIDNCVVYGREVAS